MKNYHPVGPVLKSNEKLPPCGNSSEIQWTNYRKRGKIATTNSHIHDHSLSWISTGTSIKSDRVKLVLCTQPLLCSVWGYPMSLRLTVFKLTNNGISQILEGVNNPLDSLDCFRPNRCYILNGCRVISIIKLRCSGT